ncbi:MAG: DUF5684 domain-containing protein [Planctomycetaceae bacterium]
MTGLMTLLGSTTSTLLADDAAAGAAAAAAGGILIVYLLLVILMVAGMWATFAKAGKPGWASIIPIYNVIVLLEIVGRPIWWFLLLLIPIVGLIIAIVVTIDLAKSFGKGAGFGLLLIFLPFIGYPMLGFGSARYVGPAGAEG